VMINANLLGRGIAANKENERKSAKHKTRTSHASDIGKLRLRFRRNHRVYLLQ
jgi:hypothetical protein